MKKIVKLFVDSTLVKLVVYLRSKIINPNSNYKLNIHNILREKAVLESSLYVEERLNETMLFQNREQLWDYSLSCVKETDGLFLEFGVFDGTSINYFAKRRPESQFYGFDSFEGLREDWVGMHRSKGSFNLRGKLPRVCSNVELIKGWFHETIPEFLSQNDNKMILFVHIDSDTYEAATIVLNALSDRLNTGTIVVFDEYLGYPNWRNGEFKAWQEFVENNDIKYKYRGFSIEAAIVEIL